MIEVTESTISWYVDDNKLLHKNTEVILDIINGMKKYVRELSIVIVNKHTFLGINIEIQDSTIQFSIVENLEECIEIFGEDVSTLVTYPATNIFFKVREDAKQLIDKKRKNCSTW